MLRYADDAGIHELHTLFSEDSTSVSMPVSGTLQWAHANADQIGFYRQRFDQALLTMLRTHWSALTSSEQIGLLDDQWAFTRNGSIGIATFLDILNAATSTDSYVVLDAVVAYLRALDDLVTDIGNPEVEQRFRRWVGSTFRDKQTRLGFVPTAGEDGNDTRQRVAVVQAMTRLAEDETALREATAWAQREAADAAYVDGNLAPVFIAAAAQSGDAARFQQFVQIYQARRSAQATPHETDRYLYSFPIFRQPQLVRATLELLDEGVLPQESLIVLLVQMLHRKHSQLAAWDYVKANWPYVKEQSGLGSGALVSASGELPARLRDDVVAFFDANLDGAAQQSYARALETMDQLAEFKTRSGAELIEWLQRH